MSEANTLPPHAPPTAAPRSNGVLWLIIAALFMFVLTLVLLYSQWVKYREPEFEVIVTGTHHFDGAIITIESVTHDRKLTGTFGDLQRTELPFFLPEGHYTLSAQFKEGMIGPIDITLPPPDGRRILRFELITNESAATRPSAAPSKMVR